MKIIVVILFLTNLLLSDTVKVYLYSPEINVNNFKSLKIGFDTYLSGFGGYEFQPFNDKKTFEKYLGKEKGVIILSSWHYGQIAKKYNLEAKLVAKKKGSVTDKKILVGQNNSPLSGIVTTAYDKEYSNEMLKTLTNGNQTKFSILKVPKEIDALMSVGFGMSKFALVSQESFKMLQTINPSLSKDLKIYYASDPEYRMILATNDKEAENLKLVALFKEMGSSPQGKTLLNTIGIDKMVVFNTTHLEPSGEKE